PPAAQIELDQFVQTRAPSQQLRRAALLDGPGDARFRHRTPQRSERWQRVNHVADGAEFDNQDPHKSEGSHLLSATTVSSCVFRGAGHTGDDYSYCLSP